MKIPSLIVCTLMLMASSNVAVHGQMTYTNASGVFTYATHNGAINLTGFVQSMPHADLEIPATIGGLPVTTAAGGTFSMGIFGQITIPQYMTNLAGGEFIGSNPTGFTVDPLNPTFASTNSVWCNKKITKLIQYPTGNPAPSVTIVPSITTIGDTAFYKGANLTEVVFPNGLTEIGTLAFYGCSQLKSVSLPESVSRIGVLAFFNCNGITNFDVATSNVAFISIDGVLFSNPPTNLIQFPASGPESTYVVPSQVTTIGSGAFGYCQNLVHLTIPKGVAGVSLVAFFDCPQLQSIDVDPGNTNFSSDQGVLFNKSGNGLIQFPTGKPVSSYAIPTPVSSIGIGAFAFSSLTNVEFPETLKSVDGSAFNSCSNLTSILFPAGVTNLGPDSFGSCSNLTSVYFQGPPPAGLFPGPTIYHIPGYPGWDTISDPSITTGLWTLPYPVILNSGIGFSSVGHAFEFTVSWATNIPVVVEAKALTGIENWVPVSTNTFTDGISKFTDSQTGDKPTRAYRARSN